MVFFPDATLINSSNINCPISSTELITAYNEGLNSKFSRNSNLTKAAAVISVGSIQSGIRFNIIPETSQLIGTIRTLDPEMKEIIRQRINTLVPSIAEAYGGKATVKIQDGAPITFNDPKLTNQMVPTIERVLGKKNVEFIDPVTGAEDFSYFQLQIPGFYFFLGGTPLNIPEVDAPSHHTPEFFVDDSALEYGVNVLTAMAKDYLKNK